SGTTHTASTVVTKTIRSAPPRRRMSISSRRSTSAQAVAMSSPAMAGAVTKWVSGAASATIPISAPAATNPATRVRAPAASQSADREKLAAPGNPPNTPDSMLAQPSATNSRRAFMVARVRAALDLAARGRVVALVSSGDAGIYALAALVFELLDTEDRPAWNRIGISIAPGISAMQAAAAKAGAPLGHDFCAISLSDLLTPWADIARRLGAAGEGDFVIALYNPVSARRRHQIEAARDILLRSRDRETPVLIARNLARLGEEVRIIPLADLGPDDADMTTLVLIGNSRTRLMTRGQRRWLYTPRGYGVDQEAETQLSLGDSGRGA
ncbi:MAG: precorrin-3B C(17)-methyltransferase, partial [Proteobacteria bacterium]|nr:precorrin-3B C(17)-methyltransferase [Pseudomonadota bacterium]